MKLNSYMEVTDKLNHSSKECEYRWLVEFPCLRGLRISGICGEKIYGHTEQIYSSSVGKHVRQCIGRRSVDDWSKGGGLLGCGNVWH